MARKRAQDLPLPLLHEQRQWLRAAGNNVSEEAIEFATVYSRGFDDLGDFELRAQGKQTPEQRLKRYVYLLAGYEQQTKPNLLQATMMDVRRVNCILFK